MSEALGVILAALAGFAASWLTNRRERRTADDRHQIEKGALELDERRVDGEAIERAQAISERITASLQQEVTRLERIIDNLRRDLAESQDKRTILETRVRDLESTTAAMKQLLKDAGIEYAELTKVEERP